MEETTAEIRKDSKLDYDEAMDQIKKNSETNTKSGIPVEIRNEVGIYLKPLEKWGEVISVLCTIVGILGILAAILVPLIIDIELAIPTAIGYLLSSIFTIIGGCLFKRLMYFFAILEYKALNDK